MEKIKELYHRYRELLMYLIFGVLTTVVNYVCYLLAAPFFSTTTLPVILSWCVAVAFAYVTNRVFVFRSRSKGRETVKEAASFVGARFLSGIMDVLFMAIFADWLGFNDKLMKLVSNVFVVIFNYIASKLFVFKGKEKNREG